MKFVNKRDEEEYHQILESYNDYTKRNLPFRQWNYIEIRDYDEVKMFQFPLSLYWISFYGTFKELYEKLKNDFPNVCKDLKFYNAIPNPIII